MMDLSDILDLQDVMTTTIDEDIPDLEDSFRLWIWTMVCINIYTPWTISSELMQNCTKHNVLSTMEYAYKHWSHMSHVAVRICEL